MWCQENGAFEKERHVRKLVTIGVCAVILGTASSCTTCRTTPGNAMESIRAGSDTVGFGDRAGGSNYYCQPGVCQSTGLHDPDYRVCLGGAASVARSFTVTAEARQAMESVHCPAPGT
jgi:hypothetical protein